MSNEKDIKELEKSCNFTIDSAIYFGMMAKLEALEAAFGNIAKKFKLEKIEPLLYPNKGFSSAKKLAFVPLRDKKINTSKFTLIKDEV